MNHNQAIRCSVCNSGINVRVQVGYDESNKVRFCCPECGIPINVEVVFKNTGKSMPYVTYDAKNASVVEENFEEMQYAIQASKHYITTKDTSNPHNDVNVQGIFSPFLQMRKYLGKSIINFQTHCKMGLDASNKFHVYERINKLYSLRSKYFVDNINKSFDEKNIDKKVKDTERSMLEGIYFFNIHYFNHFLVPGEFAEKNKIINTAIADIKKRNLSEFNKMVKVFCSNGTIEIYEKKLLRTIDSYIKKFRYFMPAISLKYLLSNVDKDDLFSNFTIRTMTFYDIKNVYIEVYENILDVYSVVIALNNIFYRDLYYKMGDMPKELSSNYFKKNKVKSLDDFMHLTNGCKIHYLKEKEIFNTLMPKLNNKLRNMLGHESWIYDDSLQKISSNIVLKDKVKAYEKDLLEYAYECYDMFLNVVTMYKLVIDIRNSYIKLNEEDN